MKIEYVQPMGKMDALIVVFYDEEREVRGVKVITRQLNPEDRIACVIETEEMKWDFPTPHDHDYGLYPEDMEMETIQIELEHSLYAKVIKWCTEHWVTPELLLQAILYFWVAPENRNVVEKWIFEWKAEQQLKHDFKDLKTLTPDQFLEGFDGFLDEVASGSSPIRIKDDIHDVLLFGWEDYWNRFSLCYPPGERERVEQEIARQADL